MDLEGITLAIAVIHGWTGGRKGPDEAARADDILTIVQMQFEAMPAGPKLIAGDLNGTVDAFQTLQTMLSEKDWTDLGMASNLCEGRLGQAACQTKDMAKESRIDYLFANEWLYPAVTSRKVDQCGDFPHTHRPLII